MKYLYIYIYIQNFKIDIKEKSCEVLIVICDSRYFSPVFTEFFIPNFNNPS